jgi:quercetin 2,3-dioxygenase
MITFRESAGRRHLRSPTQQTWKTFDRDNAGDPLRLGFRALASLNEALLRPMKSLQSFASPTPVASLTYVVAGSLIHRSPAGGLDRMDSGGFRYTRDAATPPRPAANGSLTDCAEVIEILLVPDGTDPKPGEEQKRFLVAERRGVLRLVASPNGDAASIRVGQDLRVYSSVLDPGTHLIHELRPGRGAWLHVVRGRIQMIDHSLSRGDGAGLENEPAVSLTAQEASEVLLLDLT